MAPPDFVHKTGEEYRKLQQIERSLSDVLGGPADAARLSPAFEHLRAHMIKLFALEDVEGFLNVVTVERPDKMREATRFRDEHHALTNRAAEILAGLRTAATANDSSAAGRLSGEIRGLLSDLRRHEEAEGGFVQALFSEDISAHD